jgi:hypothetical protein
MAFLCSVLLYVGFALTVHNETVPALLVFTPYILAILCVFIGRLFSIKGNNIENLAYFALTQLYVFIPEQGEVRVIAPLQLAVKIHVGFELEIHALLTGAVQEPLVELLKLRGVNEAVDHQPAP